MTALPANEDREKKFRVYVLTGPTFWRAEKALDTKRIFPLGFKLI